MSVSAADAPAKKPWVYQPVERPAIPAVKNSKWVRTPIDAFVLAKLEAANLAPSKEADRATFIRRATLDTWGLLPTPDEVRAFEKDHSKDAYEKLVERLLASPRYGERWGRRWLDLSRYADSDGYNGDGPRPNIWRYRDYVIKAFNDDKPFDRFVKEQIAGDELWPDDHEALIATGFLRNFPDEINARDLNLKKQEVANDLTDTVGTVLLGSTVGCAQCHNHKFDKISQKEYYQLQAYFVNTSWVDDVPAATAQEVADYEKKKAKYEAATKEIQAKMDAILQPVIDKLEDDRVFGFVPETRVSITKPEAERTAYDRWIYHRNLWTMQGRTRNAVVRLKQKAPDKYVEYTDLEADLKKFDKLKPKELGAISTVTELGHADSPPTYVLFKGIYDRKLEEVQPGTPALFSDSQPQIKPTATSSGRRTALANWIVSPENPLTARVFVNRVWGQYFGHAIIETVGDFGKMSAKPTNPELLDYLAALVRARRQLEHQGAAAADPAVGYLPTGFGVPRGCRKEGSAEHVVSGVPASASRRGADPRLAAAGRGFARRDAWGSAGVSAAARHGQPGRLQREHLEDLGESARSESPQRLHLREAQQPVSVARHVRLGESAVRARQA